ncbi:MAG: quinolinate synthase NadA [Alphaproteobacteria bacterium]|nr:quinolinate synthase NadA [Alphaproteobacteria bacterium]
MTALQHIREKLGAQYSDQTWEGLAPYIEAINRLKRKKNAVVLAHNYMTPDIFHGVADIVGDSLKLAQEAAKCDAAVIVQAGVYFMAETSKILCPEKTVLMPDMEAGCSLSESITGADVRLLKEKFPDVPVVTYVNTSAEVKAESDVCCTSGNATKIIKALAREGHKQVLMIPDEYLAMNTQREVPEVKILTWKGKCEVHERFTADDVRDIKSRYGDSIYVIAHPECHPDVIAASDYSGSTAQLQNVIETKQPARVLLITECSMGDNLQAANPKVEFVRSCFMCPHMKRITLPKILKSLETMTTEVHVPADVIARAQKSVNRMLELSR